MDEEKQSSVFTFDEAKVQVACEKSVRGVRTLVIKREDNRRSAVIANNDFAASICHALRNLTVEALARYFVCTKEPNIEDGFDFENPGTITDMTTVARQEARCIGK